jgi:hypothetical protein
MKHRFIVMGLAIIFNFSNYSANADEPQPHQLHLGPVTIGSLTFSAITLPYQTSTDTAGKTTVQFNGLSCLVRVPAKTTVDKLELLLELFDASDSVNPFAFIHSTPIDPASGMDSDCSFSGNGPQIYTGKTPSAASLQVKRVEAIDNVRLPTKLQAQ